MRPIFRLALAGAAACGVAGCATSPPPVRINTPPGLMMAAPDASNPAAVRPDDGLCRNLSVPQRAENSLCR